MRGMSVRHVPGYVKRFMRHELFPDDTATLRALYSMCVALHGTSEEFELSRFLILAYPYTTPESGLNEIIRCYQSTLGEMKASVYDPIIQECRDIVEELREEVWLPEPRTDQLSPRISWQVFVLPGGEDYVFIYDTTSDMSNVDIDAVSEALTGLDRSSMLANLSMDSSGPVTICEF